MQRVCQSRTAVHHVACCDDSCYPADVLEEHLQTTAETGKAALVKTAQGLVQAPTQLLQVLQGQGMHP